ncbi:LAQU0S20e00804g1_1 [Lachancea quebecensis]|uniref:LAQU0S20e00804g1_1 n=1 Tax=Lachancea quebecensis TaxID=1654605 RepID=A0A0P1KZC7_9SACH|nr:LAQU0S20e00804g1_1 [Lachancea quebecensis]
MVTPQKHKKFDEQEEALKDVPSEIPEKTSKVVEQDSDASSSDEDEAPEEEGMAQARSSVQQRDRERQQAAAREQEALREKRRKQDLRFKQQQEQKREREEKELEARLKAQISSRGAAESSSTNDDDDMVPAELPENFFEELEEQESATITTKPQHVNFNDIDDNYSQEIKEQLQKQKKKTLRQLRKTSMKRGPVKVNLLPPASNSKSLAPQQDTTVTNKREKWLKRKALARK